MILPSTARIDFFHTCLSISSAVNSGLAGALSTGGSTTGAGFLTGVCSSFLVWLGSTFLVIGWSIFFTICSWPELDLFVGGSRLPLRVFTSGEGEACLERGLPGFVILGFSTSSFSFFLLTF